MAAFYFSINLGANGINTFPKDNEFRRALAIVNQQFSGGVDSADIVVDARAAGSGDAAEAIAVLELLLDSDPIFGERATQRGGEVDLTLIQATMTVDPTTEAAKDAIGRLRDDYIPAAFSASQAEVLVTGDAAELVDGDPHMKELWSRAERLSNSPGGFRAIYEAIKEIDVHAALPSVQAPCLVLHAATDSMFVQHAEYLAEQLPDGKHVPIEGVWHFTVGPNTDRIVAEVEEFLTGTRSAVPSERVLATLLFIDVVGSTEHAAELGDRRWRETLQRYYGLVRRHVERYRGIEVGTEGDGFCARFDGPARAVACARAGRDGVQGLGWRYAAALTRAMSSSLAMTSPGWPSTSPPASQASLARAKSSCRAP